MKMNENRLLELGTLMRFNLKTGVVAHAPRALKYSDNV